MDKNEKVKTKKINGKTVRVIYIIPKEGVKQYKMNIVHPISTSGKWRGRPVLEYGI